jgi:hypothetical protein
MSSAVALFGGPLEDHFMIMIGVDPHKSTHTATALVEASHQPVDSPRIEATLNDYRKLLRWAKRFEGRRWAVENAHSLGRHVTQLVDRPRRAGRRCATDGHGKASGAATRRPAQERCHRRRRGGQPAR